MNWRLLILLAICSGNLLSQTILIKDSLLNAPIENVTLHFQQFGVVSDKNGAVNIDLFNDKNVIEFSHIAYYTKKIAKENLGDVVFLMPKTTMLPTVILSEEIKTPLSKKYPIFKINPRKINRLQASIGEVLASESSIFFQESQSGGGSPNYRGMEANRLLLIIDGVPLNNTIFRSGHLQNSATINPFFIESITLLSGPASVGYGDGAMGGALVFNTLNTENQKATFFNQQFESSSNSVINNFKTTYNTKNAYHITAFSVKSASNLKMGKNRMHGYSEWGKEASIDNEQLYTNYKQADFLHKSKYKINLKNALLLNTQYSKSSNIFRFDKMNDLKNGLPKYENWYYGPQIRFLQSINYASKNKTMFSEKIKTMFSFQDVKESRHIQKTGEGTLNNRCENVKIYDFNIDVKKTFNKTITSYGGGIRRQAVSSSANISDGQNTFYNTTRYPGGGSVAQDVFAYSQVNFIVSKIDVMFGLRYNSNTLKASFNIPDFSIENVENLNTSFVTSILLSFTPIKKTTINAAYYSGFRNPNIDDMGKIFSKDGVNVVVPNTSLKPEYANNLETSINCLLGPLKLQIQLFNTQISNAINREFGSLNGSDSVFYDGEMMRIQMNKNIESASISGASLSADFMASNNFLISASCNYLRGKTKNNNPLAHIPPFNSKLSFNYQLPQHMFSFYTHYNGWKLAKNYDEAGVDNYDEATIDGSPSWYTLNFCYTNKIDKHIHFTVCIKNILDSHYKTFSSGLSASGRNFVVGLNSNF